MAGSRVHMTPRGSGLVLAGLVALLMAFFVFHILLFALGLLTIGFVLVEFVSFAWSTRGFAPSWFSSERVYSSVRVSRRGVAAAGLRVGHRGDAPFYVEVFDSLPASFSVLDGSPRILTWWSPGEDLQLMYAFQPQLRGSYSLGPTGIVAHDPFGFAFREVSLATRWDVTVVPNAPSVGLGRYSVRLRNRSLGTTSLRRRGYGTEFRGLRDYHHEDDYRSIAWKRSGRGRYFVKEFEQENRQDFQLLLDVESRMGAGVPGATALDMSVDAAVVVSSFVLRHEDRIGLTTFAQGPVVSVMPGRGSVHYRHLNHDLALASTQPGKFDLAAALDHLTSRLTNPTHVIGFVALSYPDETLLKSLSKFRAKGHRLYLFAPEMYGLYPGLSGDEGAPQRILTLAQEAEKHTYQWAVYATRHLGIPVIGFGSKGAVERVISLYSRLRAWGFSK